MNVVNLLKAYRALEDAEKKQRALDRMTAEPLNYAIIRDLVNSASYGIIISVTLKDGTKLDIKREDKMDRLANYSEAF